MMIDVTFEQTNTQFQPVFDTTIQTGGGGVVFIPDVSENGILSWTNNGELPNPEPVNIRGEDGQPGYTPVKGTDYWTEADKAEMVADILSALPVYNGEVV